MKKLLSVLLTVCLLLSAFPLAAAAAEADGEAAGALSGKTGDCTWTYDDGRLTISGSGAMADYYESSATPWFQQAGHVKELVIGDGVTHIGDKAFAYFGGVTSVWLPDSLKTIGSYAFSDTKLLGIRIPEGVTEIGTRAFQNAGQLAYAVLPESLQSIGIMAFGGTALCGVALPNPQTQVGYYAFGYDTNANKTPGFSVTGYRRSTAQNYADSSGFSFVDIDSPQYALSVNMGDPVNMITGESAVRVRAGERVKITPRPEPYVTIKGYSAGDVEFEEKDGCWYFTMPARSLTVYVDYVTAKPITVDFSQQDSVALSTQEYVFLTVESSLLDAYRTSADAQNGVYTFDFDNNGADDVRLERYRAVKLSTASIAHSVSFSKEGLSYSPVTFLFAGESLRSVSLFLRFPQAGDSYDFDTDSADVSTMGDDRFSVADAKWYNEWGIAPDHFEGGQKYFAEIDLRPAEDCAFSADTTVATEGSVEMPPYAKSCELRSNGDLHVVTATVYLPGQAHRIIVNGGMAARAENLTENNFALTEARAGEKLWLSVGTENIPDDRYVLTNTLAYASDEVVIEGEAQQFFIMPDNDVTVDITYATAKQMDGVMDLRGGAHYLADTFGDSVSDYYRSQAYGIRLILMELSKSQRSDWNAELGKTVTRFDIDGDGTDDVEAVENDYSLLETNSLSSPTGQLTLRFTKAESIYYAMRQLTIIFADPTVQKHTITVNNGIASSVSGDWQGEHRIYEAYPGEYVYLLPDVAKWDNEFAVQGTIDATSEDTTVYTEGRMLFVMPDKDVTATVTYEKAPLQDGVMDLRSGSYVADKGKRYAASESYGMYFILQELCARRTSQMTDETGNMFFKFDIDDFGGYDIGYDQNAHTFSLLEENSLRPASGRVTLMLPDSKYHTVPMHRLTILVVGDDAHHTAHTITVNGGFASTKPFSYDHLIPSQRSYEIVYILPDPAMVPDGQYTTDITVTSPDVEITVDMGIYFIMPEHDVTVNVHFPLAAQKPCTLDFSEDDKLITENAGDISDCLAACSVQSYGWYDDVQNTYAVKYDIDGDGKYDVTACPDLATFLLLHHAFSGVKTLTCGKQESYHLPFYPLTLVFSKPKRGDVNGDGKVDIADATALQRALAEFDGAWLDFSNGNVRYACDVNDDGSVDVRDVTGLQRMIAEIKA